MNGISPFDENFVVTKFGVVSVSAEYIQNDFGDPIKVSWKEWQMSQKTHARLTATAIMEKRTVTSENIVCLKTSDKCLWFTRFEIECDKKRFNTNFGSRFLFQIPFVFAEAIMLQFAKGEDDLESLDLCSFLQPTPHMFRIEDFPSCKYVTKMHNFTDRVFSMSFRPATTLLPLQFVQVPDNLPKEIVCMNRGEIAGPKAFDVFAMPSDCATHLIKRAVQELVKSPFASDFEALINMRRVCKTFKNEVDLGAKVFLDEQHRKFENIHVSEDVKLILEQRNFLLDCFIDSMALHRDCLNRNVHTLMRVRKFANPGANPAKKRSLEERQMNSIVKRLCA